MKLRSSAMRLRGGKTIQSTTKVAAPTKKPFRYPVCPRHGGRAMCVACMMGGHTKASWKKASQKMHDNPRHPYRLPLQRPGPPATRKELAVKK